MELSWKHWHFTSYPQYRSHALGLASAAGFLLVYLAIAQHWSIDTAIQDYFYNAASGEWLIDRYNVPLRSIFYHGMKYSIFAFGFLLIAVVIIDWVKHSHAIDRKALLFVITCLISVPSLMAWLKYETGIPCPYQLQLYGGVFEHKGLLNFWWPDGTKHPRCFPAGHPSGGFALLALVVVSSRKKTMLAIALSFGGLMSYYQMARGAHFLSHCVTTLLLSIIVIILIHFCFLSFPSVSKCKAESEKYGI